MTLAINGTKTLVSCNPALSPYGQSASPTVQQLLALRELRLIQICFAPEIWRAVRRKRFSRGVRGTSNVELKGHELLAWKNVDLVPIAH